MRTYLGFRLLQFFAVVFGASAIVFFTVNWATDPVSTILPVGASEEAANRLREALGFNDPILVQFGRFLAGAVQGDFGDSIWTGRPALTEALRRVPATIYIVLPATIIGVFLGSITGLTAGMRPGSRFDNAVNALAYGALSIAEFWLGIMLILLFAVQLGWLPSGGYSLTWSALAMPVAALSIRPLAQTSQVMRSVVVSESRKDYVVTARSKGVSERAIALHHVLRNASIPVLTLAAYNAARQFIGAAVAVEVIFSWPGLGRLSVEALQRGDIYLLQAIVVVAAIVVGGLNFGADVIYFWLDPRTRSLIGDKS